MKAQAEHTSPRRLPMRLKDRLQRWFEYVLDWRLRGVAVGVIRLTRGGIGRLWHVDLLLLTTRGRKTGKPRTVVLPFFRDGPYLVIVAANAGRANDPDWFHNLRADPTARVEIADQAVKVRGEVLPPAAAAAFWPRVLERLPGYARYPRFTQRSIPMVRLVPVEDPGAMDSRNVVQRSRCSSRSS
jgi:deazaflavin-dependent oxidoreductase (nitroreductase family)